jgi:hypothetical protein
VPYWNRKDMELVKLESENDYLELEERSFGIRMPSSLANRKLGEVLD